MKMWFFKPKIFYCVFDISKEGLHTSEAKISAISVAPKPENVTQLKSILGLIIYYVKFFLWLRLPQDMSIKLSTDASEESIEAVISHVMSNDSEKPISYAFFKSDNFWDDVDVNFIQYFLETMKDAILTDVKNYVSTELPKIADHL